MCGLWEVCIAVYPSRLPFPSTVPFGLPLIVGWLAPFVVAPLVSGSQDGHIVTGVGGKPVGNTILLRDILIKNNWEESKGRRDCYEGNARCLSHENDSGLVRRHRTKTELWRLDFAPAAFIRIPWLGMPFYSINCQQKHWELLEE